MFSVDTVLSYCVHTEAAQCVKAPAAETAELSDGDGGKEGVNRFPPIVL